MHQPRNRQGHVWLLAGTGEGPALAAALQAQGFQVSVSVVTEAAALPYRALSLHRVWVGELSEEQAIVERLRRSDQPEEGQRGQRRRRREHVHGPR